MLFIKTISGKLKQMNSERTSLKQLLWKTSLIFVSMIVCSCNGKNSAQNSKSSENDIALGTPVSSLDESIWTIYQDKSSDFWFGSNENGVFHYDGQKLIRFTKEDGLIGNQIRGIQEDAFGNIYFETTNGISQFDGKSFHSLKIDGNSNAPHPWRSGVNDLWFSSGYQGKGPLRFDGEKLYNHEFPKSPQEDTFTKMYPDVTHSPYGIYSIFKDSKGHIWFGTSDLGIYRFDGESIRYLYEKQLTETPNGGAFGIRSIAEDSNGYIWICNSNYKYEILPDTIINEGLGQISYNRLTGIKGLDNKNQYYLAIIADDNGNLWMLTYENGLWKNDGNDLIHYPVNNADNDVKLLSIFNDNQGVLWLGTERSGIFKFNGKSFEKFQP